MGAWDEFEPKARQGARVASVWDEFEPEPAQQPAPERTWGQAASDTWNRLQAGFEQGDAMLAGALDDSIVGDMVRRVDGGPMRDHVTWARVQAEEAENRGDPGAPRLRAEAERIAGAYLHARNFLTNWRDGASATADEYQAKLSPKEQADLRYVQGGDGILETATRYIERPGQIPNAVIQTLPSSLPGAALAVATRGLGTPAQVGANLGMAGTMASADARQQAGQDAEEAGAGALDTYRSQEVAGDKGFATGVLANLVGLGGELKAVKALTHKVPLSGSRLAPMVTEPLAQITEEGLDEAGSQWAANEGARATYDPARDPLKGVGAAAVHGAVAAGAQGVFTGGMAAWRGEHADTVHERDGPRIREVPGMPGFVENLDHPEAPPFAGAVPVKVGDKTYWVDPSLKAATDAHAAAQQSPTMADMPDLSGLYGHQNDDDDGTDGGAPMAPAAGPALSPGMAGPALSVGADTGLGLTGADLNLPTAPVFPDPQADRIAYPNGLDFERAPVPVAGRPALSLAVPGQDDAGAIPYTPPALSGRRDALAAGIEAHLGTEPAPALTPQTGKKAKAPKPVRVPDWQLAPTGAVAPAATEAAVPPLSATPAPIVSAPVAPTATAPKPKNTKAIDPAKDELLTAIAKAGGLSREMAEAQGIDPADFGRRGQAFGAGPVFRKSGGLGFDEMAELLSQHGYPVHDDDGRYSGNTLLARVDDSLRGQRVLTPVGQERGAERQAQLRAEEEALGAQDHETVAAMAPAIPEVPDMSADERLAARLYGEAMDAGYGVDQIEALFEQGDSAVTYHRKLQGLLNGEPEHVQRATAARTPALSARNGAGRRQGADETTQPGAARGESGRGSDDDLPGLDAVGHDASDLTDAEVDRHFAGESLASIMASRRPALDLAAQTEAGLRARHEQRTADATQQAERDRQAEQKAGADRARTDFALTGSDRASDANPNQGDLLGAGGPVRRDDYHAEPSAAQKEAGNYRKEHVQWHGLDIAIENQAGTVRRGTDENGKPWATRLAYDYGYLKGTKGADGDQVDVFLGPNLTGDTVFIVNQQQADGAFDEHKVMLGFASAEKAEAAYRANYEPGWNHYQTPLVEMSVDQFKQWLREGDTTQPAATQSAGTLSDQLAAMSDDDLSALIDDVAGETRAADTAQPVQQRQRAKQAAQPGSKARTRKASSKAEGAPSTGELAQSLGVNLSSAGQNALDGLAKLFGGKGTLSSGLTFDEERYQAAKPHFATMLRDFQAAGKDLRDLVRALLDAFGTGVKPYILRFAQELRAGQTTTEDNHHAERTDQRAERDRSNRADGQSDAGAHLSDAGRGGVGSRTGDAGGQGRGRRSPGKAGLDDGHAVVAGERGDHALDQPGPSGVARSAAGSADRGRSAHDSPGGLYADRAPDGAAASATEQATTVKKAKQAPAKATTVTAGDVAEIQAQMPFLTDGQAEDVAFAERRFAKPDGSGVLFTNGTGTGKTFTGLGVVARLVARGKHNLLIAVPKQTIADAWIKAGKGFFGLDIKPLASTQDNGKTGLVVTTFANMGDNDSLAQRDWDGFVMDEAHYLSSNEGGERTQALKILSVLALKKYAATGLVYRRHADKVAQMRALYQSAEAGRKSDSAELRDEAKQQKAEADALQKELAALVEVEQARIDAIPPADRPRAVFLSATPFAYEKSVSWANEFLFDWGDNDTSGAYNSGSAFDRFMMAHFGYRMRYNKLTEPDAKVDRGLMQRAFNAWLKREGVLSGRALDSNFDYDRRFVLAESAIGRQVDEALKWLSDHASGKQAIPGGDELRNTITKKNFDHQARLYFLEAIKAREAIGHIQAHLDAGRKVVVMHDFKKGGVTNPFRLNEQALKDDAARAYAAFENEFGDLIEAFDYLPSPITQLKKAFPAALVYNGSVSAKQRIEMQNQFNDDADGAPRLIIAQGDAMREGVSIHDTSGKFPRVLVHLGMPTKPTAAIQQEGRIYRTGQASDALFRYFTIGTAWERSAFASKIAGRASAAENLAMGEAARGLKQAFIDAYEEASDWTPGFAGEGLGGKAMDKAMAAILTPWDMAKSLYFGTKRQGQGRAARGREGKDYFATPEPVGLKMAEWAGVRPGEDVLEPSAGHGAIARWFPDSARKRAIEPSAELASRLALHFDGDIVPSTFEDHHVVNKYDAIVMNPPFGSAGRTAIDHLAKAVDHLREGGRVVALIPTGPAADKKFDAWFYATDDQGRSLLPDLHLVRSVKLPAVTFERAGTAVANRIVVLEKAGGELAGQVQTKGELDLSHADTIAELFDRLENVAMPERAKPLPAEDDQPDVATTQVPAKTKAAAPVDAGPKLVSDAPAITHTTMKGKVLEGIIERRLTLEQAQQYDPYAFKKDGGVFIRLKHVQRPTAAQVQEVPARYESRRADADTARVSMRLSTGETVNLDLAPAQALVAARTKVRRLELLRACAA